MREKGHKALTIVIKLGTSSIVDEKTHEPLLPILSLIVQTAVNLRKDGHRVIIVSSGAIGVGLRRMDIERRPKHLPRIQALAAIGQCRLISLWDSLFAHYRQPIAQILLTRNDIADRTQYLNAQNTFAELLEMGVIPIVNENDTIAVTEIKFGDNDTLSAITAAMIHADYLFLMTDVDCLYNKNPRTHTDAQAIEVVEDISALTADGTVPLPSLSASASAKFNIKVSSAGSALGTGGMSTKIVAARLATSAGVTTVITRSSKPGNISNIVSYCQSLKSAHPHPHPHPNSYSTSTSSLKSKPTPTSSSPPSPRPEKVPATISSPTSHPISPTPDGSLARSTDSLSLDAAVTAVSRPKITAPLHTRFIPSHQPIRDRYFWLLHGLAPHGTVYIDAGAHRALENKAGLLPVGIVDVAGSFAQQEAVRLVVVERLPKPAIVGEGGGAGGNGNAKLWEGPGVEVGRALVNYSAAEIARIKGIRSSEIEGLLGYAESEYVALRENISFFVRESRPVTPTLDL